MNVTPLLLAAALLASGAPPARAHPPGITFGTSDLYTHQHLAGDMRGDLSHGWTCGFSVVDDATGVVVQDPKKQTGEVHCGPWVVANDGAGSVTSVTVVACLKVNDSSPGGGVCRLSMSAGNVGALWDTISFHMQPGDAVHYCTTVSWTGSKGGGSFLYDAEDTPGDQCPLATYVHR